MKNNNNKHTEILDEDFHPIKKNHFFKILGFTLLNVLGLLLFFIVTSLIFFLLNFMSQRPVQNWHYIILFFPFFSFAILFYQQYSHSERQETNWNKWVAGLSFLAMLFLAIFYKSFLRLLF